MNLLADNVSRSGIITIAVLCILVVLFILIDVVLVFSLHRQNTALAKKKSAEEEEKDIIISDR